LEPGDLAQLRNRIQHARRAYTARERKALKTVAESFRSPAGMADMDARAWLLTTVTELGVGEALVSTLRDGGVPAPVQRVKVARPASQIEPVSDLEDPSRGGANLL
jgi:hypothetical protein